MSLATRCPACGTIFRVVQDQLKVSEGWVRCGQCHEVFHGIEALFDLGSDPAIAARRAARGGPPGPPSSTRAFADNRANTPIPPPASAPGSIGPTAAPGPMRVAAPPAPATRAPGPGADPGAGLAPAGGAAPSPQRPPSPPPAVARGIAPRFAARLAEEAARAQSAPPSTIPSPFPETQPAPEGGSTTDYGVLPSRRDAAEAPPAPAAPAWPAGSPEAQAGPTPVVPPSPAAAPARATRESPTAWPSPASGFAPSPVPARPTLPSTTAWHSTTTPPATAPAPSARPPQADAPPSPAPEQPGGSSPAPWRRPAAVPAPPAPTIWEPPSPDAPEPDRPSFTAPTEPMPLDDLSDEPFTHEMPLMHEPGAEESADGSPAPPPSARQPRTITPRTADEPASDRPKLPARAAASGAGGSTLPSLLAEDAADDERRAGPPTLASLLPEDAGEWPPRKKNRKERVAPAKKAEPDSGEGAQRGDPRFLREARSDARWRRPWVRAVLGTSLALLLAGAAGQIAWPLRDTLAARWPETLPAWQWLCEQAGCRIEPPRSIASLTLDGSSLNRTDTEHVLLFSADLHNRADHEVGVPSFDLTFTDINGAIVSRKVLSPAQIGIHQAALGPDAEMHVHARLQVGTLDASGFQAEMFYP